MGEFSFSDHKYIREFEDALNSISVEVRPASDMAVLSDDFATRKPYWTWLRHKAIGQLKGNPHLIMEFFGQKTFLLPIFLRGIAQFTTHSSFFGQALLVFPITNPLNGVSQS